MELEELQSAWTQMSDELNHQKKLTNQIILDMTKQKYQNKFSTITKYETLGAVVCFANAETSTGLKNRVIVVINSSIFFPFTVDILEVFVCLKFLTF